MGRLVADGKRFDCELVIFDKNGTLIDQRKALLAWANARREAITRRLGREGSELWERIVGVDLKKAHIDQSGPLATAVQREEILIASCAAYLAGKSWSESKWLVQEGYKEADVSLKPPFGSVDLGRGRRKTSASETTWVALGDCFDRHSQDDCWLFQDAGHRRAV
jgi:hypothetical protein